MTDTDLATQRIQWVRHADKSGTVMVATVRVMNDCGHYCKTFDVMLRIDLRPSESIRLDRVIAGFGPWEAIDGGDGFATLDGAMQAARLWVLCANVQQCTSPRVSPEAIVNARRAVGL